MRLWRTFVAALLLVPSIGALPALAQECPERLPRFTGDQFNELIEYANARLPALNPPGNPGPITGDGDLDDRIWEIAFERGYEMRPTAVDSNLVSEDRHRIQPLTASAWDQLEAAASADGQSLRIESAYRSVETQRTLFRSRLDGTSDSEINETLASTAPPGASRHHSGYALDLATTGGDLSGFEGTPEHTWISSDNYRRAKCRGFVPSYPPGVDLGPNPEPWEYVYVGMEAIQQFFNDEIFFYRADDGAFRYYDIRPNGALPSPMLGWNYQIGWDAITAIDLEGDGQDELFFYRDDGVFRFYNVRSDGSLPYAMVEGHNYTTGWDAITAIDLDGDGQDEMFFYRDDGIFRFYNVRSDGSLPRPMLEGDDYTTGWDSIIAIDLDGGGQDEVFFYRNDGVYRFYNVNSDGTLPRPMREGDDYTTGWDAITGIDLDGDFQDEMFFYRSDGVFRFYHINPDGSLPAALLEGDNYTTGWDVITGIQLD